MELTHKMEGQKLPISGPRLGFRIKSQRPSPGPAGAIEMVAPEGRDLDMLHELIMHELNDLSSVDQVRPEALALYR